jgi:hypothetical protein
MGEIRSLIDESVNALKINKQDIYEQIKELVHECGTINEATHFLWVHPSFAPLPSSPIPFSQLWEKGSKIQSPSPRIGRGI